jgi:hypothetical protein
LNKVIVSNSNLFNIQNTFEIKTLGINLNSSNFSSSTLIKGLENGVISIASSNFSYNIGINETLIELEGCDLTNLNDIYF